MTPPTGVDDPRDRVSPPRRRWVANGATSRGARRGRTLGIVALAGVGALASLVVAACGSPLASTRQSPLTALVAASEHLTAHSMLLARLTAGGAAVLILCWLVAVRAALRGQLSESAVWWLFAVWAAPLVVGAPLLSADVYSYVGDAHLLAHGHDPYSVGPAALGPGRVLDAVDPQWRQTPAPYGPLALLLLRVVAAGGVAQAVTFIVVLATADVAVTGVLLARMVPDRLRPVTLAMWLLAPPVLLHLVGGGHVDAVMVVLLVGGFVLAAARRPLLAVTLAGLATAVKAPAVLGVAVLCVTGLPADWRGRVRTVAARLAVAVATSLVPALLLPAPLGLVHALSTPGRAQTLGAPVVLVWQGVRAARQAGLDWLPAHLLTPIRVTALAVAAAVALALLATHRRRPAMTTAGVALLVLAAAGPVYYGWYAAWSLACLAATTRPRLRQVTVLIIAVGSLPGLPGLARLGPAQLGLVVATVAVVLATAWLAPRDEVVQLP